VLSAELIARLATKIIVNACYVRERRRECIFLPRERGLSREVGALTKVLVAWMVGGAMVLFSAFCYAETLMAGERPCRWISGTREGRIRAAEVPAARNVIQRAERRRKRTLATFREPWSLKR
jgi:hypothetical protein